MLYRIILALLSLIFALPFHSCQQETEGAYEASYESLGIPLDHRYEGVRERTAWDIEVYDNKLFVASGDYDKNAGPVNLMHYDLSSELWVNGGTLPDEQAERFILLNDTLVIPGADPKDDWNFGNYYSYANSQWVTNRNIPGGIHTFDMVAFDDQIFAGIGVSSGQFPIAVSSDSGNTFEQLPMFRDGAAIDTTLPVTDGGVSNGQIRVYEFFTLKNSLYALYFYTTTDGSERSLYRYDGSSFAYAWEFPQGVRFNGISYQAISAETEFKNRLFFSTGYLYVTDDLQTVTQIDFGRNLLVSDLRIIDNKLFCSAIEKTEDGQYRTSLWSNKTAQDSGFHEEFYFTFPCPAQCFTYHDCVFYFGMGDGRISDHNESNGTILVVKPEI